MTRSVWAIVAVVILMLQSGFSGRAGALTGPELPSAASSSAGIFHVAIFRFPIEHLNEAMAAFRELAAATRREPGNLSYDVYRGKDDAQTFYIAEHWATSSALLAHEKGDVFIRLGQGVLGKYATLHDTVTANAFNVAMPIASSR